MNTGITWVKRNWADIRKLNPHLKPRRSPWDASFDLHVNVASGIWAEVSTHSVIYICKTYICDSSGEHVDPKYLLNVNRLMVTRHWPQLPGTFHYFWEGSFRSPSASTRNLVLRAVSANLACP